MTTFEIAICLINLSALCTFAAIFYRKIGDLWEAINELDRRKLDTEP